MKRLFQLGLFPLVIAAGILLQVPNASATGGASAPTPTPTATPIPPITSNAPDKLITLKCVPYGNWNAYLEAVKRDITLRYAGMGKPASKVRITSKLSASPIQVKQSELASGTDVLIDSDQRATLKPRNSDIIDLRSDACVLRGKITVTAYIKSGKKTAKKFIDSQVDVVGFYQ